jgi:hypothetical protein
MKRNIDKRLRKLEDRAGMNRRRGQELCVITRDETGRVLNGAEFLGPGGEELPGRAYLTIVYVDTKKGAGL